MFGLILKDLYYLKKQLGIFSLLIVFYLILGLTSDNVEIFGFVVMFLGITLPITVIGLDEKAKWDKYALAMPISRKDLVISKYLLAISFIIITSIINLLYQFIVNTDHRITEEALLSAWVIFCLAIIFNSALLPAMFKFGVEKGRIILVMIVLVPMGLIFGLDYIGITLPSEELLNKIVYFSPAFVIIILLVSIFISVRIYNKKDF